MAETLKELFEEWKQAQDAEVDEIEKKINEMRENEALDIKDRCEGYIFEQYYYKNVDYLEFSLIYRHFQRLAHQIYY